MLSNRVAVPCLLLALALVSSATEARVEKHEDRVRKLMNTVSTGAESSNLIGRSRGIAFAGRITGPGEIAGITYYDYQHNGSMGRQVGYDPAANVVHFVWMHLPSVPGDRRIAYNAWDIESSVFLHGSGVPGGKLISDVNGGYTTMDVTSAGAAAVAFHQGASIDLYCTRADFDAEPPLGTFDFTQCGPGPLTCEGWVTGGYELGSRYIWPVIDADLVDGDTVLHIVSTEAPPTGAPAGEVQTIVYYRKVNDEWPACAMAVDSVYVISPVVRSSPVSDKVAIVWLKPIYYDGDPNDPCGFSQWQQDVVYIESPDGGETWGTLVNVTDYSEGGTISIEGVALAFTDVSALYVGDTLHVVWDTPLREPGDCDPQYSGKLWHWDSSNQCISTVYDATYPRYHCDPGAWCNTTAKMNISECDGNLYVSFTRFGAHTSPDGDTNIDCSASNYMANGEVFASASSNGGVTWGEAINLTNTFTPDCDAGDCLSEHWSSMAKYSTGNIHILYIEDHDPGQLNDESSPTENPVKYLAYECFSPETFCEFMVSPVSIGYPTFISPLGQTGCTGSETITIDLAITNTGSEFTAYAISADESWIHPGSTSGDLPAGCDNVVVVPITFGPIEAEGVYMDTIAVTACGSEEVLVPVELPVYCEVWLPEYQILSSACWSIGVWNTGRAGTGVLKDPEGNMFWWPSWLPPDGAAFMYDESIIITYAQDTCKTWFSMYDGSDSDVSLMPQSQLTTASFPTYEYAHALWSTSDTAVIGEIEYYLPTHSDTCVLIERIEICNNRDTAITVHIGEAIDWDIPDAEGGVSNACGVDNNRQMVYQYGPPWGPEQDWHGGASFWNDVPGAIVLDNATWIYPNSGYEPCEIGGLLARHSGFNATCDSPQDYNSVFVVDQTLALEPDSCACYCMVKASSLTGLADLQLLIDKGILWIWDRGIDCGVPRPCEDVVMGDADTSGQVDIDDAVRIIGCIFLGEQCQLPRSDPDCSCHYDIDDVVHIIAYIFSGGAAPCTCGEWIAECGPLY